MFGTQWSYMVYFGMVSSSNHQMTVFIFQVQKSQSAFSCELFFFMSSQDGLRVCWALNTSRISGCKTKLRKMTFYCVLTFVVITNIIIYICTSKSMKPFPRIFPLAMNQISGIISFSAEDTTKKTVYASPEFFFWLWHFFLLGLHALRFPIFNFLPVVYISLPKSGIFGLGNGYIVITMNIYLAMAIVFSSVEIAWQTQTIM